VPSEAGIMKGSSGVKRKFYAPFQGGLAGAIPSGYPAPGEKVVMTSLAVYPTSGASFPTGPAKLSPQRSVMSLLRASFL
jgi:hypothetical protein